MAGRLVAWRIVRSGPTDGPADRIRGAAVIFGALAGLVTPLAGVAIAVAGWQLPRLLAARSSRRADRALDDEVFLAVQLCMLGVHTGAGLAETVAAVAIHLPGRLGVAFAAATDRHRNGALFDDALAGVADELGEPVAPLIGVLRAAHVDGDPVEPALIRLGDRLRDRRRRATEAEVRRLSVRLLLPLVCCSLPGFVSIAVVPLALDALGGLTR